MYWYTAAEKMHPIWLTERTAVYYALSLDQFVTPLGRMLLEFPGLMQFMTSGTIALEVVGPLLALSPVWTAPLRLLAIALFITFHAGLGLTLHLGLFPLVCIAAWLVFLPAEFWAFAERRAGRRAAGATIYFDADCGFCRRVVLALRELLLLGPVALEPAQADPATHALMREGRSWIVRDPSGGFHIGYDAFVTLARLSPLARWTTWLLGSRPARLVGERLYRAISNDRSRASRVLEALTPPAPRLRLGLAGSAVALVALVLVEAALARRPTLDLEVLKPVERKLITLGQLGQSWQMFAPYPTMDDGWYVIEGLTADGRRLDIWNGGGPPDYAKPPDLWPLYRNSQWQKYLTNMWQRRNREYRVYFGEYLCRSWNARHPISDQVELLYVNYMLEWTPRPGDSPAAPTKESVLRYSCQTMAPLPMAAR
jgi:predicted DCC family thiol-disulfide oxidoreductase YuxK